MSNIFGQDWLSIAKRNPMLYGWLLTDTQIAKIHGTNELERVMERFIDIDIETFNKEEKLKEFEKIKTDYASEIADDPTIKEYLDAVPQLLNNMSALQIMNGKVDHMIKNPESANAESVNPYIEQLNGMNDQLVNMRQHLNEIDQKMDQDSISSLSGADEPELIEMSSNGDVTDDNDIIQEMSDITPTGPLETLPTDQPTLNPEAPEFIPQTAPKTAPIPEPSPEINNNDEEKQEILLDNQITPQAPPPITDEMKQSIYKQEIINHDGSPVIVTQYNPPDEPTPIELPTNDVTNEPTANTMNLPNTDEPTAINDVTDEPPDSSDDETPQYIQQLSTENKSVVNEIQNNIENAPEGVDTALEIHKSIQQISPIIKNTTDKTQKQALSDVKQQLVELWEQTDPKIQTSTLAKLEHKQNIQKIEKHAKNIKLVPKPSKIPQTTMFNKHEISEIQSKISNPKLVKRALMGHIKKSSDFEKLKSYKLDTKTMQKIEYKFNQNNAKLAKNSRHLVKFMLENNSPPSHIISALKGEGLSYRNAVREYENISNTKYIENIPEKVKISDDTIEDIDIALDPKYIGLDPSGHQLLTFIPNDPDAMTKFNSNNLNLIAQTGLSSYNLGNFPQGSGVYKLPNLLNKNAPPITAYVQIRTGSLQSALHDKFQSGDMPDYTDVSVAQAMNIISKQ